MRSSHDQTIDHFKKLMTASERSIAVTMNQIIDQYNKQMIPDERVEQAYDRLQKNKNSEFIQKETQYAIFEWAQRNAEKIPALTPLLSTIDELNKKRDKLKNSIIELLKEEMSLLQNEIKIHKNISTLKSKISKLSLHSDNKEIIDELKKDLDAQETKLQDISDGQEILHTLKDLEEDLSNIETEIRAYGGRVLPSEVVVTPEMRFFSPEKTEEERKIVEKKLMSQAESVIKVTNEENIRKTKNAISRAGGLYNYLQSCLKEPLPEILLLRLKSIQDVLEHEYKSKKVSESPALKNRLQKNMQAVKKFIEKTHKKIDDARNFKKQKR